MTKWAPTATLRPAPTRAHTVQGEGAALGNGPVGRTSAPGDDAAGADGMSCAGAGAS